MSIETNRQEWHYMSGMQPCGPVSLDELSALISAGHLSETVLIATKETAKWRPAAEVFKEIRGQNLAESGLPPLPTSHNTAGLPPKAALGMLDQIEAALNQVAGTEKLEGFSLGEMFSETFQHRTTEQMEDYFIVGTELTTPKIDEVQTGWPKPWLFMRLLFFIVVLYIGFVAAWEQFHNPNLIPGLLLMGSFAMPLATLVLFFELNTPRNVSLYRVIVLVGLGGITSLVISLMGFNIGHLNWLGASSAGIIEELGKLAALILLTRKSHYKYILNGMLLAAAVGTGFAAFESAGYAFRFLLQYGDQAMLNVIWVRALLAPFGHVVWMAMVGGALWRAKGADPITREHLMNPRFYRVLLIAMALHMLWDAPFDPPFCLKEITLGAIAWFIIWGLVQQGLRQVRADQRVAEATTRRNIMPLPTVSNRKV